MKNKITVLYIYMGCPKSNRIDQNFCTSDYQNFMKICLSPFETMLILNPKVGTMPRKLRSVFAQQTDPKNLLRR